MANFRGTVISENGKPIDGVRVQVGWRYDNTDKRGRYAFNMLSKGTYNVTFSKENYKGEYREVNIVAGQNELNVTMQLLLGVLIGTVVDQGGAALPGVSVVVQGVGSTSTNLSGDYQINNIVPGAYNISFSKAGYQTVQY